MKSTENDEKCQVFNESDVKNDEVEVVEPTQQTTDEHTKTPIQITKSRYWQAVLWCENMVDNWEEDVAAILEVPFAYCIHDKDVEKDGVTPRKAHVHMIIAFTNTTTYKHALNIFKCLGANAVNTCTACKSIRNCYDYLIHDTEDARKKNKHQYSEGERVTGNNFDIGFYEQISAQQRREMLMELRDFILREGFTNIIDFTFATLVDPKFSEFIYQDVALSYTATIDKFCAGNYKKLQGGSVVRKVNNEDTLGESMKSPRKVHEICCPECGSLEFRKKDKTAGGAQRFVCKDCGKTWSE